MFVKILGLASGNIKFNFYNVNKCNERVIVLLCNKIRRGYRCRRRANHQYSAITHVNMTRVDFLRIHIHALFDPPFQRKRF